MESAAKGSGTAYDAFKKLGVSVLDSGGQMKDAETIFLETIDALGEVKNATEQDQLAMDIFGKVQLLLPGSLMPEAREWRLIRKRRKNWEGL